MSETPLSRENIHEFIGPDGQLTIPVEPAFDKKGNSHLFADDAATVDAHIAAEEGKWEKFAQPGFEVKAKTIAENAKNETAYEDAIWEDHSRTLDQEAERQAEEEAAHQAYLDAEDEAANREHQAYLDGSDEQQEIGGDLEARSGVSNQESIVAAYEQSLEEDGFFEEVDQDEEEIEDPLAGDVDPTGGYHEEVPSPSNTQHYHALERRGLL